MRTEHDIMVAALKTQDPGELFSLVEEALDVAKFHAAQLGFSKVRVQQLKDQNARQLSMINNYEATLFGRK